MFHQVIQSAKRQDPAGMPNSPNLFVALTIEIEVYTITMLPLARVGHATWQCKLFNYTSDQSTFSSNATLKRKPLPVCNVITMWFFYF